MKYKTRARKLILMQYTRLYEIRHKIFTNRYKKNIIAIREKIDVFVLKTKNYHLCVSCFE